MLKPLIKRVVLTLVTFTALNSAFAGEFEEGYSSAQKRDYQTAIAKWEPLAHKGDADAQFNLGLLYHSGIGGKFSEEVAVSLYKKAAEAGQPMAQAYLAAAYFEGWLGLKKDTKQGEYWLNKLESGR